MRGLGSGTRQTPPKEDVPHYAPHKRELSKAMPLRVSPFTRRGTRINEEFHMPTCGSSPSPPCPFTFAALQHYCLPSTVTTPEHELLSCCLHQATSCHLLPPTRAAGCPSHQATSCCLLPSTRIDVGCFTSHATSCCLLSCKIFTSPNCSSCSPSPEIDLTFGLLSSFVVGHCVFRVPSAAKVNPKGIATRGDLRSGLSSTAEKGLLLGGIRLVSGVSSRC